MPSLRPLYLLLAASSPLLFPTASAQTTDITGTVVISDETVTDTRGIYVASAANVSAVVVENGADFTCTNCVFSKTGNSTDENDSSFSALNAAVAVQLGGTVTLHGSSIYTEGLGAHGFKLYEANSTGYIYDSVITTTDQFAHGVYMAGGYLYVEGTTVVTNGEFTGAFSTDKGAGTLVINDCNAITLNEHSNLIYSTGNITATNLKGQTLYGTAGSIDGTNTIEIYDSDFSVAPSYYGVFQIFNSGGTASGVGSVSVTGGSIAETRGEYGLLLASNAWAVLTLTNVDVALAADQFVNSSATDGWGTTGDNGGNATVYMIDQTISGSIIVDDISNVTLHVTDGSSYTGQVNEAHADGHVDIYIDASSKWTVTGDSFVRILVDGSGVTGATVKNIVTTGTHTVYYTAAESANSYLKGKVYALSGGGYLKPLHCYDSSTKFCNPGSVA